MDQIRFNQQNRDFHSDDPFREIKPVSDSKFKKNLKILALILVVAGVIWAAYYFLFKIKSVEFDPAASEYYAVFLTNGQVYFGKPLRKDGGEFVIYDAYYLQVNENANAQQQLSEPKFSLVKLGQELHGPTDKMYINQANVLFYEQLKNESQVVKSIKNSN